MADVSDAMDVDEGHEQRQGMAGGAAPPVMDVDEEHELWQDCAMRDGFMEQSISSEALQSGPKHIDLTVFSELLARVRPENIAPHQGFIVKPHAPAAASKPQRAQSIFHNRDFLAHMQSSDTSSPSTHPTRSRSSRRPLAPEERVRACRIRAMEARARIAAVIRAMKKDIIAWSEEENPGVAKHQAMVQRAVVYATNLREATHGLPDPVTKVAQAVGQTVLQSLITLLKGRPELLWKEFDHYDTARFMDRAVNECEPTLQIVYFMAIMGKVLGGSSRRASESLLNMFPVLLETFNEATGGSKEVQDEILQQIPKSLDTVLDKFNLDSPAIVLAVCPKCHSTYQPKQRLWDPKPVYPDFCTNVAHPAESMCWERLMGDADAGGSRQPLRPALFWPPEEFIARLLSRKDLEVAIDDFADEAARKAREEAPELLTSMADGEFVRSFKGPDGKTLFVDRPDNEVRVFLSMCYDGLNLSGLNLRGESHSWGIFILKCPSLPPHLQSLIHNMHPMMLVYTKKEITTEQMNGNGYLRPIVDAFKVGWHTGVRLSRTAKHETGRRSRFALAHICCDSKARPPIGAFGDIMSYHCSLCDTGHEAEGKLTWAACDWKNWKPRDLATLKEGAKLWREAATVKERGEIHTKYRIKDPILLELPYWHPTDQIIVDGMHVIENLCGHLSRAIGISSVEAKLVTEPAFDHTFLSPLVAWWTLSEETRTEWGIEEENIGYEPSEAELSAFSDLDLKDAFETEETRDAFEVSVRGIHRRLVLGTYDDDPHEFFQMTCDLLERRHNKAPLHFVALSLKLKPRDGVDYRTTEPVKKLTRQTIAYSLMEWRRHHPWQLKMTHPRTGSAMVKARVRHVTEHSDRPSWFDRPPVRYTEQGVGSIKASEQKNAYAWDVPVALVSLWGRGTSHPAPDGAFYANALNMVLAAVQAFWILGLFNQSATRARSYRNHLKNWIVGLQAHFPEVEPKPSWHLAFHIYDFILLFGPLMSWWLFPFERMIGYFQRIPQNHQYELHSQETVMQAFMRGANLRHWLNRPDCPPILQRCRKVIDKAYGRTDDSYTVDGVAFGQEGEEIEDTHKPKFTTLPGDLAEALGVRDGVVTAHHRMHGVVYSRASTHVGNSLVTYLPDGDWTSNVKYGSIQYIFKTAKGDQWRFAVKQQLENQNDIVDPYAEWPDWPAKMMSSSLSPRLDIIELEWVQSHYNRYVIPETPEYVATLRLNRF